jgi:tetratricopeptide (TPR) repeat protein
MRAAFAALVAAGLALHASGPAMAAAADFAAALDAQWDYGKPALSESRFRAELGLWPADHPNAVEAQTQIARAQGMQRDFAAANATLDGVAAALPGMPAHVRVRYLLERGRTLNSSGVPEHAVPLFTEALALADCNDDPFYAIDAAHMLGIAAPAPQRLDWDLKALAMTERTTDARSKRWLAPLYDNIGVAYEQRGDDATALVHFRKALPAYEARGDPGAVRIAHWMIAHAQRKLGALDEAERTQRRLAAELDRLGEPDGYVFEELAEIAIARGDVQGARPWAAKAHAALKDDPDLAANEAGRLARLASVAAGEPPPAAKR